MTNICNAGSVLVLNGKGGATPLSFDASLPSAQPAWIHLNYSSSEAKSWLTNKSNIEEFVSEAMLARETRPRTIVTHNGILLILRAMNSNPKAEPEDMISLRIWIEENRIITASKRKLLSIGEVIDLLKIDNGPRNIIEFLDELTDKITNGISAQIDKIDLHIDQLEEEVLGQIDYQLRPKLAEQRKQIIALKRFVAPQRDALSRLTQIERFTWLSETDRIHFMETSDRTIRCVEDLDEAKDRATVVQETLSSKLSEKVEQRMYILSMVAAIFLPLGFITGLLGINVGGIPGSQANWAFAIVSVMLIFVAFFEYWLFKKKRWI